MVNPLEQIHEGMKVYDSGKHEIGTVDYVRLSDENPANPIPQTAGVNPAERPNRADSLVSDIVKIFDPDEIPDELKSRLLREGFVRLDAYGLFNADRYIFPDQIQSVSGDQVMLKVDKSELIKEA